MNKRILFIDDELELWGTLFRKELGSFGFEVITDDDPHRALEIIEQEKPDVVLLDICFPEGYLGKIILEQIKARYPALPVMMITSTMDKEEYKAEDYQLANYRYSKHALTDGDFTDLATQLDLLIEKSKQANQEKTSGEHKDSGIVKYGFIIGTTEKMKSVIHTIEKVATQDITVLITGESGTGKELVARAIHKLGQRKDEQFLTVVCAAVPRELLESELFGHEKGAFSGAISSKKGKFEVVGEGTIFLDEIGEMPLDIQVKLLRFLQKRQFERVGSNVVLKSKARIIAATNSDLQELISQGKFREDLYFRMNIITIHVPPLRDRKEDIPTLFEHFVEKANALSKKKILTILRDDVNEVLGSYNWPGNIREFENVISRAVALADENILQPQNLSFLTKQTQLHSSLFNTHDIVNSILNKELSWEKLKQEFASKGNTRQTILIELIKKVKEKMGNRITSQDLAKILSISPSNMRRILSEYRIKLKNIQRE